MGEGQSCPLFPVKNYEWFNSSRCRCGKLVSFRDHIFWRSRFLTGFDNVSDAIVNKVVNSEQIFYNALTVYFFSDYKRLEKIKNKHGSWAAAWDSLHPSIDPEREFEKLGKIGITLALRDDPVFPSALREIPLPPFGIYFRGSLPPETGVSLSLVGTRKATPEGEELAYEFARAFAKKDINIVSGLALGIDAASHKGALKNGRTSAVLATGVDDPYPHLNKKLAEEILSSGGALISEYPPGSPPLPYRFLERNRIVSGLSRAVVLIEAPERSGSLATARFALEQNRDIFVVPGPANHKNYKGSHSLIREGARLASTPQEILEDLGLTDKIVPHENTEEENVILELVRSSGPLPIDEIIETAKLDTSLAIRTVSSLVLSGKLKEKEDGYQIG